MTIWHGIARSGKFAAATRTGIPCTAKHLQNWQVNYSRSVLDRACYSLSTVFDAFANWQLSSCHTAAASKSQPGMGFLLCFSKAEDKSLSEHPSCKYMGCRVVRLVAKGRVKPECTGNKREVKRATFSERSSTSWYACGSYSCRLNSTICTSESPYCSLS